MTNNSKKTLDFALSRDADGNNVVVVINNKVIEVDKIPNTALRGVLLGALPRSITAAKYYEACCGRGGDSGYDVSGGDDYRFKRNPDAINLRP